MMVSTLRPIHGTPRARRPLPRHKSAARAVVAIAAVVLLSGCSTGNDNVPSPAPSTSTATTPAASATATSTTSATAESTVDAIVQGFPSKLIPVMKGATVTSTSLDRATPLSTASMTATSNATSAAILAYYTTVFTGQGFTAQPGNAVDGVPTKTFVRANGQEIITVSIAQSGSLATITIGANVLPASLK